MIYYDSHAHLTDLTDENLHEMAVSNIRGLVSPVQLPAMKAVSPNTVIDMWDYQLEKQLGRAKKYLITAHAMIGVSMVSTPKSDLDLLLEFLPAYLARPEVVAIGEIGFEPGSKTNSDLLYQHNLFERQVEIAQKTGVRLNVHLPNAPDMKIEYTKRCLSIFKKHNIDMEKVIFDHCTDSNIDLVLNAGAYASISVQPWRKITPENAAKWVMEYKSDYVMVDSDASSLPTDCLVVPKVALALQLAGADNSLVEKTCYLNCRKAYGI